MAQTAENVFRDFVTDGVPASGANKPAKAAIRELLTGYETVINAFTTGGGYIFETKAAIDVTSSPPIHSQGWVVSDPVAANNGIYRKTSAGATWEREADLPYSFIKATNAGAGTANAIVATSSIPIPAADAGALIAVNVTADNTGPVTVSFNGAAALPIKTNSGNDIAAGGLVAGVIVAGYVSGGTFRLLSDQASAAIQAAAEAAAQSASDDADRAEDAAAIASGSMTTVLDPQFSTKATAEAWVPPVGAFPDYVRISGRITPDDDGGGNFVRRDVEPTHAAKLSLSDGITTKWYELDAYRVTPAHFGADGGADDTAAFHDACLYLLGRGRGVLVAAGNHTLDHVDLSSDVGGSIKIRINGTLTHKANATGDMFTFGTKHSVEVCGTGTIDGNHTNQATYVNLLSLTTVTKFVENGVDFANVKQYAIAQQGSENCKFLQITGSEFLNGALHNGQSGALARYCVFVQLRGGEYNRVAGCRFIQETDPIAGHNKNPAGIVHINTGTTVATGMLVVENCYFENLGFSSNGNHLCPLDVYSYVREFRFSSLVFRKSRLIPLRVTNFGIGLAENIDIDDQVQQYYNDTTLYTDAAMMSFAIVDRGYVTDDNDISCLTIRNSDLIHSGGFNAAGISVSSGSTTNIYHLVKLENTRVISTGANAYNGLFANAVKAIDLSANTEISGFGHNIRLQQTSNIAPLSAEATCKLTVRGGYLRNASQINVRADLDVANLDVLLDDVDLSGAAVEPFRLNGVKKAVVRGCDLGGVRAQVSGAAKFWMIDNSNCGAINPTGLGTVPFYRLRGNQGLPDVTAGT